MNDLKLLIINRISSPNVKVHHQSALSISVISLRFLFAARDVCTGA